MLRVVRLSRLRASLALVTLALIGSGSVPGGAPASARAQQPAGFEAEMDAAMLTMMRAMDAASMSGVPEEDFLAMMIPHHQGAIDMAKVELQYGKDPELRKLAEEIVKAQEGEIAFLKQWQAKHARQ